MPFSGFCSKIPQNFQVVQLVLLSSRQETEKDNKVFEKRPFIDTI